MVRSVRDLIQRKTEGFLFCFMYIAGLVSYQVRYFVC